MSPHYADGPYPLGWPIIKISFRSQTSCTWWIFIRRHYVIITIFLRQVFIWIHIHIESIHLFIYIIWNGIRHRLGNVGFYKCLCVVQVLICNRLNTRAINSCHKNLPFILFRNTRMVPHVFTVWGPAASLECGNARVATYCDQLPLWNPGMWECEGCHVLFPAASLESWNVGMRGYPML